MAADVTPGAAATAPVVIPVGAVGVANGATRVPIRCTLVTGRCIGTVRLQSGAPVGVTAGAARVKKLTTYGKAKVRIRAGHKAKVKVRLNRAGRALVRRHRRAKVYVNVKVAGKRTTKRVTLKR
jgi:hypothetical protein